MKFWWKTGTETGIVLQPFFPTAAIYCPKCPCPVWELRIGAIFNDSYSPLGDVVWENAEPDTWYSAPSVAVQFAEYFGDFRWRVTGPKKVCDFGHELQVEYQFDYNSDTPAFPTRVYTQTNLGNPLGSLCGDTEDTFDPYDYTIKSSSITTSCQCTSLVLASFFDTGDQLGNNFTLVAVYEEVLCTDEA